MFRLIYGSYFDFSRSSTFDNNRCEKEKKDETKRKIDLFVSAAVTVCLFSFVFFRHPKDTHQRTLFNKKKKLKEKENLPVV